MYPLITISIQHRKSSLQCAHGLKEMQRVVSCSLLLVFIFTHAIVHLYEGFTVIRSA